MKSVFIKAAVVTAAAIGGLAAQPALAQQAVDCPVRYADLKKALINAATTETTGLNLNFWGVVVNRAGLVCAVAFSGATTDSQWGLSRQIAAAKAFTANGLSLESFPISTAQLYPWVQPSPSGGNPLFGLAAGNPVDAAAAYAGDFASFGTASDPMVGKRVGGTITFGGGFALYDGTTPVGGVGLSGDTACADHSAAWRTRIYLDKFPSAGNDRLTFNNATGHPRCPNDANTKGVNP